MDDLKSMVMNKFPMTLAKMVDPSDIIIRLEPSLSSSSSSLMPSIYGSPSTPATRKALLQQPQPVIPSFASTSPSSYNSPISPIPISASKSALIPPRVPSSEYSNYTAVKSVSPATQFIPQFTALEADKSVWAIMDSFYPMGMGMENAFIVETTNQPYQIHASSTSFGMNNNQNNGQNAGGTAQNQRKSFSNETITEGKEEYFSHSQRRMKSVSGGQSVMRSNTPSNAHRRSQSNPAEQSSAVLLMPSTGKSNSSSSSFGSTNPNPNVNNRDQSRSPERLVSPIDGFADGFNNSLNISNGTATTLVRAGQSSRTGTPGSKITNGTSTMAKVLPSVNVLIVEDNLINLRILSAHLRRHRIHYDVAKNGQEAIDKWRKGGFHLVLMDIQLPVMSGLDASKEIRRLEKLNHIGVFSHADLQNLAPKKPEEELDLNVFRSPVIIVALTASNLIQDKQQALAAGCNDYLTKPVNLDWLLNKITEWGCMQALIDFDGWKSGERMTNISAALPSLTRNASARKVMNSKNTAKY